MDIITTIVKKEVGSFMKVTKKPWIWFLVHPGQLTGDLLQTFIPDWHVRTFTTLYELRQEADKRRRSVDVLAIGFDLKEKEKDFLMRTLREFYIEVGNIVPFQEIEKNPLLLEQELQEISKHRLTSKETF